MARYALVLALLLPTLLSCSQASDPVVSAPGETPSEPEAPGEMVRLVADRDVAEDETGPVQPLNFPTASVVYLANNVTVHGASGSMPAEIAMELFAGDRITVGEESSCEIHVGEYARVMLEENTTVTVRDIALTAGGGSTRIAQRSGALLAKVNRLAGNDRFVVETPSLVAGVRGTEFATTVADDGAVAVAVADGVVSVRDFVPEIDAAVPETEDERETVAALADALEASGVAVEAGQQVSAAPEVSAPPALPAELATDVEISSLALDPEALVAVVAQIDAFVARAAEATPTRAPTATTPTSRSSSR
jgi:hypothetical protein